MTTYTLQFDRPLLAARLVTSLSDGASGLTGGSVDPSVRSGDDPADPQSTAMEQLLVKISTDMKTLQNQHAENLRQVKSMSVSLATLIVGKLVGGSEMIRTQRLEQLLEEALQRPGTALQIHIHPQDRIRLDAFAEKASLGIGQPNLVADEAIGVGECRVEFATYELTSSLTRHLDEIEQRLLEVIDGQ